MAQGQRLFIAGRPLRHRRHRGRVAVSRTTSRIRHLAVDHLVRSDTALGELAELDRLFSEVMRLTPLPFDLSFLSLRLSGIKRRLKMADDLTKRGTPDNDLISIKETWELRDWAKKFGVTEEKLKQAVQAVGHSAKKVREYLGK